MCIRNDGGAPWNDGGARHSFNRGKEEEYWGNEPAMLGTPRETFFRRLPRVATPILVAQGGFRRAGWYYWRFWLGGILGTIARPDVLLASMM